jgi:hypothetical protein
MPIYRSLLALSVVASTPTPGFADDTPGPPPAIQTADPAPEPAPASTTAVDAAAATPPAPRYSRSVIARPLTLPKDLGVAGGDVIANHDFSTLLGAPVAGYGITDDVEVQLIYGFTARELEMRGTVDEDVGVKLVRGAAGGKLEVIARVRAGYDALAETATPLRLGVHAQYNLTDRIALISGAPGTQQLRIALAHDEMMARPIDLGLPLGVGVQPTPELYLQLDTKLVQLDLHDSATAWIGADATPVALTVVYNAIPALDVQAAVGTDLSNSPADSLSLLFGVRWYAGRL